MGETLITGWLLFMWASLIWVSLGLWGLDKLLDWTDWTNDK